MSPLTQGDLQIQSAIPIIGIQHFHMEQRANAHTSFHIEAIIPEEEGEEALLQLLITGHFSRISGIYKQVKSKYFVIEKIFYLKYCACNNVQEVIKEFNYEK